MLPASYSSVQDIYNRYPPMGSVSRVTSGEIHTAIGHEQARIDGMLGARYIVPFNPVPPLIEMICGDITCLRIVGTRVLITQQTTGAEEWTETWRHSLKLLESLAAGSLGLLSGSGTPVEELPGGASAGHAYGELWSNTMTTTPAYVGQDWADVDGDSPHYYWR